MKFTITGKEATHKFNKHWQFCVGSGHAKLAIGSEYARQLKKIHDELGIHHVRFHGILNDDMDTVTDLSMMMPLPGADAFREISFQKVGQVYDNVLSTGMKPFVELTFMPKKLGSGDTEGMMWYVGNNTPPADYSEWADYITEFLKYLIHRYGIEEIRTWYFEVWNEPDLFVFFSGTKEDYFKLYETTARAIKAVDEKIRVGGPATSGSMWIKDFRKFVEENSVPCDFFSTHQYAGDPLGGVESEDEISSPAKGTEGEAQKSPEEKHAEMAAALMKKLEAAEGKTFLDGWRAIMEDKSETEDLPDNVFRINSAITRKQAGNTPLYYTEWNENAIFGAATNDTRKVAAYDVKAALDVESNVDGSSIWCFSDIFEEMHQFPQPFHGGFGLLNSDGIPKPAFYAMKKLGEVADNRIEMGENATLGEIGIAAFTDDTRLDVVLFRQKMKNLFELPEEEAVVEIAMDREPQKVTMFRIDHDHCNPYELWLAAGCPKYLNKEETADLIARSKMVAEAADYFYENGMLRITASLGVNDVYFFKIEN